MSVYHINVEGPHQFQQLQDAGLLGGYIKSGLDRGRGAATYVYPTYMIVEKGKVVAFGAHGPEHPFDTVLPRKGRKGVFGWLGRLFK